MYNRKKELEEWISGRDKLEQETYNVLKEDILSICEKFDDTGQSGFSAPLMAGIVADVTRKLMLGIMINLVTDENVNWSEFRQEKGSYQSKTLSSLFKDGDNISYNYGFSWCLNNDSCWNGTAYAKIEGIIYKFKSGIDGIKLPFMPKTFHISVDEEVNGDLCKFWVKDIDELKKGLEYYNRNIEDFRI